jgi:hypothetical protein
MYGEDTQEKIIFSEWLENWAENFVSGIFSRDFVFVRQ